ncbi:hypothetical protein P3H15_27210 [Rhodococcus sp. T2V]|uniref:hypothetical protein n=1 Tax=Rhodococcus sp. T2V TaxID=3034164 RepID=UPI0023E0C356|nr:hypothetical protein [Rhodococcus sp. T2V]MDF3308711.1 hypothetical protein [Rhodococcus sp. T2V]
MPGKSKNTEDRDETTEAVPVSGSEAFELTSDLAIPSADPVPIAFLGKPYSVRRGYAPEEVLEFFNLSRKRLYDKILEMLICEGDPAELWAAFEKRSMPELMHVYLPRIYKIAGLMNAQGEFLAY